MNKTINEPRYVGTNWDEVRVAENRGANGTTARKVITKGVVQLDAAELIAKTIAKLRQGYEVRYTNGAGEDAIRIYPCVAKSGNFMEGTARAMNGLKKSINDKTVALLDPQRGKASGTDAEGAEDAEEEPAGVTPDTMITCEVCGHRQRVGKRRG